MSKSARGKKPQRHLRSVPPPPSIRPEDQPLFQALRTALRSDQPLALLELVSGLVTATDPRARNPWARDDDGPRLDELVESLIGTSFAQTTAALTVVRELVPDPVMAARIDRELATRRQPLPNWLGALANTRADPEVWFLTHVLGDGDDYFFGATLPDGRQLTALVYVDHNMGTVVKDAFVIPEPISVVVERLQQSIEDGQSLMRFDPADARAIVAEAIDGGSRLFPPLESESWPVCRPLVEWLVRMQPAGGVVPERHEWTDEERTAIAEDFFASRFGDAMDTADGQGLLDSILWFATEWGPGDPYRWSPVNVEILLADWAPRKILADTGYLAQLPSLLRAFIAYCHHRQGISATLTAETLTSVDRWEGEFLRMIRTDRPQGAAALAAQLFNGSLEFDDDDVSTSELMLEHLDSIVGGRYQLQNLTDEPLDDEPFDWAGIADDIRPTVEKVVALCDRCADELFDVEHRTAMRRFLGRAAAADPAIFRRKASPERGAAAVAWVICRANHSVGRYGVPSVAELLGWFGVKGSVSQRAEPLLRANGVDPHAQYGEVVLGTADLLTAARRKSIIQLREHYQGSAD
ncbi:hypothetical protein [Mycolicibacterium sp. NCC-Tsukiji]|uniref:hypothetical protein n=1 Tax=Mycolicibacterium sp. NCC-Tsukiji TaxID=2185272 RepID=UPI000EF0845F|nr:hypothetical protein [Mycolicibacterium sp. NCC-Tsukiji]GCA99161.1 hypothetical protein NCCNTM_27960 [Mycolicibacterium sp. NCC-Tsukiji]